MEPNQNDQMNQDGFGQVPQPQPMPFPAQAPQPMPIQDPIQQPVMPIQPLQQPQPQVVAPVAHHLPTPAMQPSMLAFISIGLGGAAVIAQPFITGFSSSSASIWLLLIPLLLGAAGVVVALMAAKKASLTAILGLGLVLSTVALVTSFTTLTQSLIVQQRVSAQTEKLKEQMKTRGLDSSSTQSPQGTTALPVSDTYSDAYKSAEAAKERINKQIEEARLRAESLTR